MLKQNTYCKEERLCSKKIIARLFEAGFSFYSSPFKIIYLPLIVDAIYPAQTLLIVSKKNFNLATDRNEIRRLMKESFRINKHALYESLLQNKKQLAIGIIYTSKKTTPFNDMEAKMKVALNRLLHDAASE